jgi:hypothetical protein
VASVQAALDLQTAGDWFIGPEGTDQNRPLVRDVAAAGSGDY